MLLQHWTVIEIGVPLLTRIGPHEMVTKADRNLLRWAVVVESEEAHTEAVAVLLAELEARGVVLVRL